MRLKGVEDGDLKKVRTHPIRLDLRNRCGPATRPSRLLCKVEVGKHDVARLMEQDVCRKAM